MPAKLTFTNITMTVERNKDVPPDAYYQIGWSASELPSGSRIYLCIAERQKWVDITNGFGRQQVHELCGCFRQLNRWTETVDWWLEASLAPVSNNFIRSNVRQFPLPVRPFQGSFTTQGFASDPVPFT